MWEGKKVSEKLLAWHLTMTRHILVDDGLAGCMQVEATRKMEEAWEKLIPQIKAMELEGDGDETVASGPGPKDHMVGV